MRSITGLYVIFIFHYFSVLAMGTIVAVKWQQRGCPHMHIESAIEDLRDSAISVEPVIIHWNHTAQPQPRLLIRVLIYAGVIFHCALRAPQELVLIVIVVI